MLAPTSAVTARRRAAIDSKVAGRSMSRGNSTSYFFFERQHDVDVRVRGHSGLEQVVVVGQAPDVYRESGEGSQNLTNLLVHVPPEWFVLGTRRVAPSECRLIFRREGRCSKKAPRLFVYTGRRGANVLLIQHCHLAKGRLLPGSRFDRRGDGRYGEAQRGRSPPRPIESKLMSPAMLPSGGGRSIVVISRSRVFGEALVVALGGHGFKACCDGAEPVANWLPSVLPDADLVLTTDPVDASTDWLPLCRNGPASIAVLAYVVNARTWRSCMDAGVSLIVDMAVSLDELVEGLNHAMTDRKTVESQSRATLAAMERMEASARTGRRTAFELLTPRESYVLEALVSGRSAERIASDGHVAISTVRSHLRSIYRKLGVKSQVEAVAVARRADWRP